MSVGNIQPTTGAQPDVSAQLAAGSNTNFPSHSPNRQDLNGLRVDTARNIQDHFNDVPRDDTKLAHNIDGDKPTQNVDGNAPAQRINQKAQEMQAKFGGAFNGLVNANKAQMRNPNSPDAKEALENQQAIMAESVNAVLGGDPDAAAVVAQLNQGAQNIAQDDLKKQGLGLAQAATKAALAAKVVPGIAHNLLNGPRGPMSM